MFPSHGINKCFEAFIPIPISVYIDTVLSLHQPYQGKQFKRTWFVSFNVGAIKMSIKDKRTFVIIAFFMQKKLVNVEHYLHWKNTY